jgi:ABC-type arginine transport system ATPase subunit
MNLILSPGTRVRVSGLTSESASKWNEKVGKILSFDREAGRYVMEMSKEDQLRIKPANMKLS